MSKRKKKSSLRIWHILISALLVIACITVVVLCFLSYNTNSMLNDKIAGLETENGSLESEISSLKKELDDLNSWQEERKNTLSEIENLEAGSIVEADSVENNLDAYFSINEIIEGDAVYNRISGKSYRENQYIQLSDLKYLKVLHYNFNHEIQVGEIIVNTVISEDVVSIFKELFAIEYEVQSMYLIDNYWTGDGGTTDTASIDVNNTSAFCFRAVTGGRSLSNHAYGCAIDINPQQNPYVWYENGLKQWSHSNADPYIDRRTGDPHVIVAGDDCYNIFKKYGFSWGGEWSDPIDYQHFEKELY